MAKDKLAADERGFEPNALWVTVHDPNRVAKVQPNGTPRPLAVAAYCRGKLFFAVSASSAYFRGKLAFAVSVCFHGSCSHEDSAASRGSETLRSFE